MEPAAACLSICCSMCTVIHVFVLILQQRTLKCPSAAPETPPVHRTQRSSLTPSGSRSTAAAMKSEGVGVANKPGDAQTAKGKNVKRPGERSLTAKAKTMSTGNPVVNGTGAAGGARRDMASGSRYSHMARDPDKKPNSGARPKTSPPSCTSTSHTAAVKAPKSSVGKSDSAAHPSASSTSDCPSPENGASSAHSDTLPTPGL